MAALQYVDHPNYSALIVRKTYQSLFLSGAIGEQAEEWLRGTKAQWNGTLKRWTFPSGARLQFGHLQTKADAERYLSAEYQFIGIDEATEITKENFDQLVSRLRRKDSMKDVPLRVRLATNPGGPGHDWIKERYVLSHDFDHVYIPATILDNPMIDSAEYIKTLSDLPKSVRDRYLSGDWDSQDDGLLSLESMLAVSVRREETIKPLESLRSRPGLYYLGVDVGRTRDLTAIWLWERVGDVYWTRAIEVFQGVRFRDQYSRIERYLSLPGLQGCWIDKGGIGYHLAEDLEGAYPMLCKGVFLSSKLQASLSQKVRSLVEDDLIRLPDDEEIRRDWRLIRKPIGESLSTDRDESGHGDRFWAAALALHDATHADRMPPSGLRVPQAIRPTFAPQGILPMVRGGRGGFGRR